MKFVCPTRVLFSQSVGQFAYSHWNCLATLTQRHLTPHLALSTVCTMCPAGSGALESRKATQWSQTS